MYRKIRRLQSQTLVESTMTDEQVPLILYRLKQRPTLVIWLWQAFKIEARTTIDGIQIW